MKTGLLAIVLRAVVVLTTAFSFTGCVSRQVFVLNRATGAPQHTFASGEVPTLIVRGGDTALAGTTIRVFSLPDRKLLTTEVFPQGYDDPHLTTYYDDFSADPSTLVTYDSVRDPHWALPSLPAGRYVAELSYNGQIQSHADFTVTGTTDHSAPAPGASGIHQNPVIFAPARISGEELAVERLDEIVGLTADQRPSAMKIYTAHYRALDRFRALQPGAPTPQEITADTHAALRALLTADQRAKFDEALSRQRAAAVAHASAPRTTTTNGGSFVPTGVPSLDRNQAIRAYIAAYLEHSPAVAARVGSIVRVRAAGGQSSGEGVRTTHPFWSGSYYYIVEGGARSETLKVSWEKSSQQPFQIVRIEAPGGATVPL